jgi:SWI/SNF related-matrix-associated actin-dependent regulator of chromatin subfamily C
MVTPTDQLTPRPAWYRRDGVADVERSMLPEWFNSSASHRTPASYMEAREKIISMSDSIANRNVTNSMVRRYVVGDSGSLHRLRQFLVNFGLINEDGINDSAPTPAVLRDNKPTAPKTFDDKLKGNLLDAVVEQSKKRKFDEVSTSEPAFIPIDWDEVAMQVGHGATSVDCEQNFLTLELDGVAAASSSSAERPITPDGASDAAKPIPATTESGTGDGKADTKDMHNHIRKEIIRNLIETSHGDVVKKVLKASFEATGGDLKRAQSASLLGLSAAKAVEESRKEEAALSSVLSQIVNQRMKKLENRMALLDDIEGIMEAEKVALELERRDLYTARCRHWFGGA